MPNDGDSRASLTSPSLRWLALFVIGSLLAYSSVLTDFFVSDDLGIIRHMHRGTVWDVYPIFIRPLACASYFLDYQLWGVNPLGYHLTSLFVHGLNAWAVYAITLLLLQRSGRAELFRSTERFLALAAGALFLLMPGRTESTSWISGRPGMMATLFALLAFMEYLRFERGSRAALHLSLSAVLFCCAVLCKESAVTLPVLIGFYELFQSLERREGKSFRAVVTGIRWPAIGIFGGLLIAYLGMRYLTLGALVGGYGTDVHLKFKLVRLLKNLLYFPTRPLLPAMSSVDLSSRIALIVTSVALIAVLVTRLARRERVPSLAWFCLGAFFVAALPVMNLGVSPIQPAGERLLYWASAFLAIGIIVLLGYVLRSTKWRLAVLLPVLVTFAVVLRSANLMWECAADLSERVIVKMCQSEETNPEQRYLDALIEAGNETSALYEKRYFVFGWNLTGPTPEVLACLLEGKEDCSEEDLSTVISMFDF